MLVKFVRLHVCLEDSCDCGLPETPAWISIATPKKAWCPMCKGYYATLTYNTGVQTKAHHTCWGETFRPGPTGIPQYSFMQGGIFCLEFSEEILSLGAPVELDCWLLEVEIGGWQKRGVLQKREGGQLREIQAVHAEWARGIRFLSPKCALLSCRKVLDEGMLVPNTSVLSTWGINFPPSVVTQGLVPICFSHNLPAIPWGEFGYHGGGVFLYPRKGTAKS